MGEGSCNVLSFYTQIRDAVDVAVETETDNKDAMDQTVCKQKITPTVPPIIFLSFLFTRPHF